MTILESRTIFSGRIIELKLEKVRLPDNSLADYEMVYHRGGTAIVAINDKTEVCLLKHYRPAVQGWVWEIPAGMLERHDTSTLQRAQTELREETGYSADNWQALGFVQSSPGVFTEKVHLFIATGLTPGVQQLEQGEVLEVHWVNLRDAMTDIYKGVINDAKTCIAILRAAEKLQLND